MTEITRARLSTPIRVWPRLAIIAPLLFTISAITHSLARPEHSLVTDPVSALAAGPGGWVQNVTFILTGGLLLGFAWGIHLELGSAVSFNLAGLLLAVFGLGLVGAGVFPAVDAAGTFTEDRTVHVAAGFVTFVSAGPAALALASRMRKMTPLKYLASYLRSVGIGLIVLLVLGGLLVRPASAPFHDYLGVFQWSFLAVWFPCLMMVGYRLLRTREGRPR